MAWQSDMEACDYFGPQYAPFLRGVGWLERGRALPTGEVDRRVFDRLREFVAAPWQPGVFAGVHPCDLCLYRSEAHGGANLFIPGDGVIYVCPELVVHYMNAHAYAPPPEFCGAVMACPAIGSAGYFKALLANGGRPLVGMARARSASAGAVNGDR